MGRVIFYFRGQSSVLKGYAGKAAAFVRLGWAVSTNPSRTATGSDTEGLDTDTASPSMTAVAGLNSRSSPAMGNEVGGLSLGY